MFGWSDKSNSSVAAAIRLTYKMQPPPPKSYQILIHSIINMSMGILKQKLGSMFLFVFSHFHFNASVLDFGINIFFWLQILESILCSPLQDGIF